MSDTVIKVENLSKQYRLGEVGTGTLSHDLKRWWYRARGKDDPYLKIGEANDRTQTGNSDYVWALQDINFEVKKGEVLGIIGRNGAGKSTLLKILSKTTNPTTGNIKVKGRIASLLEVGTGFHPEMTGRENIFLNGAILGMTRREIKAKFDEIVDFAGVERYVDTPVKRYSSGMYVRLAFAVAAFLEPEILIVDEVLAVGDAEFQKKCLGRMKDVSVNEGRTVLFVSHNMQAINSLCTKALVLFHGKLAFEATASESVKFYNNQFEKSATRWDGNEGDQTVRLQSTWIKPLNYNDFTTNSSFEVGMEVEILHPVSNLVLGFHILSEYDYELAYCVFDDFFETPVQNYLQGRVIKKAIIPANSLAKGNYTIKFDVGIHMIKKIISIEGALYFSLINEGIIGCRFPVPEVKGFSSLFRPNWGIL